MEIKIKAQEIADRLNAAGFFVDVFIDTEDSGDMFVTGSHGSFGDFVASVMWRNKRWEMYKLESAARHFIDTKSSFDATFCFLQNMIF